MDAYKEKLCTGETFSCPIRSCRKLDFVSYSEQEIHFLDSHDLKPKGFAQTLLLERWNKRRTTEARDNWETETLCTDEEQWDSRTLLDETDDEDDWEDMSDLHDSGEDGSKDDWEDTSDMDRLSDSDKSHTMFQDNTWRTASLLKRKHQDWTPISKRRTKTKFRTQFHAQREPYNVHPYVVENPTCQKK
jgi:hypothetical protein